MHKLVIFNINIKFPLNFIIFQKIKAMKYYYMYICYNIQFLNLSIYIYKKCHIEIFLDLF